MNIVFLEKEEEDNWARRHGKTIGEKKEGINGKDKKKQPPNHFFAVFIIRNLLKYCTSSTSVQ